MLLTGVFAITIAFLVSWTLVPPLITAATQWGFLDLPDQRKHHEGSIPRIGGVAICAGTVAGLLSTCNLPDRRIAGYLAGAVIIFLVGLIDDRRPVRAQIKLLWQFIAVAAMLQISGVALSRLDDLPFGLVIQMGELGWLITVLLMLSIINALNLIDGLDGLAGGIAVIAGIGMTVVAVATGNQQVVVVACAMAGAALAFFIFNRHPAKIFMGDCGSLFIGYTLASLSIMLIKNPSPIGLPIPLMLLLVPVADTFYVAIRRKLRGEPMFAADRTHIHHRLLQYGLTHRQTVRLIHGATLILTLFAVVSAYGSIHHNWPFVAQKGTTSAPAPVSLTGSAHY